MTLEKQYRTLTFPVPEENQTLTIKHVLDTYEAHYLGYRNSAKASYIFWHMDQPDQTFDSYYRELKLQAEECAFEQSVNPLERNLRDKLICGIKDDALRIRLFRDKDITLATVVEECKAAEMSRKHAASINKQVDPSQVEAVHRFDGSRIPPRRNFLDNGQKHQSKQNESPSNVVHNRRGRFHQHEGQKLKNPCSRCATYLTTKVCHSTHQFLGSSVLIGILNIIPHRPFMHNRMARLNVLFKL